MNPDMNVPDIKSLLAICVARTVDAAFFVILTPCPVHIVHRIQIFPCCWMQSFSSMSDPLVHSQL